jgi:predicted amidohydrolase YtcJ
MPRTIASIVSVAAFVLVTACQKAPERPADHVFLNGGIYTMDLHRSWAKAVVVVGSEITYVGGNEGARDLIGPETRVTNLKGKLLLPGFHDSHVHLMFGGLVETGCNLTSAQTLEQVREQLGRCSTTPGVGEEGWILGGNWDREPFPDGIPDRAMLDEIMPGRPVLLDSADGHSVWLNSEALELAGIDRHTPDPPQGEIARDPRTGDPTGILNEKAMAIAAVVVPQPTLEERLAAIDTATGLAHRYGITSIIIPGLDDVMLAPFVAASRSGRLALRVLASMSPINMIPGAFGAEIYEMIADRERYRGPNLSPDSVKVYIDGVLETGTALLVEPYTDEDFDRSRPAFYSQDELNEHFERIDKAGLQIHVHAIGDQAVRMALDAFEAARKANGRTDNRHHIVHLQLIHPDDVGRFAELDVTATFQALWAWPDYWIMELNLPVVGPERVERMYPIASVQRAGGRIAGGSDWSVSSLDPLEAIEVAVRRQDPGASPEAGLPVLSADERVDLAAMIEAYTISGAYLMRQEQIVGSIEVGKRADLVVLSRNLFEIPEEEINQAQVELTLFDGEIVYEVMGQQQLD